MVIGDMVKAVQLSEDVLRDETKGSALKIGLMLIPQNLPIHPVFPFIQSNT